MILQTSQDLGPNADQKITGKTCFREPLLRGQNKNTKQIENKIHCLY